MVVPYLDITWDSIVEQACIKVVQSGKTFSVLRMNTVQVRTRVSDTVVGVGLVMVLRCLHFVLFQRVENFQDFSQTFVVKDQINRGRANRYQLWSKFS